MHPCNTRRWDSNKKGESPCNSAKPFGISLITAVVIIAVFNYYISVAKGESFHERFVEMAGLSLSVAAFSFIIGYFIRVWLGVEI
jgi:VIT1/CCC1 family predicted Fe2+/Mn2+ transporter